MYLGLFGESLDHLPVGLRYRLAYTVQVFFVVLHSAFLEGVELHLAPKIAIGNLRASGKFKAFRSNRRSEGPKNTHHTVLPWSLSDLERTLTFFAQVTLPSSSNVLERETYCSLWYPDG